jgi:hypothetical protein
MLKTKASKQVRTLRDLVSSRTFKITVGTLAKEAGISDSHLYNMMAGRFLCSENSEVFSGLMRSLRVTAAELSDALENTRKTCGKTHET